MDEICIKKDQGIEEYISRIKSLYRSNTITVFRGETIDHGKTSCQPNIFRDGYLDNNEFFEKNVLDEMTANHIAKGDSYLEKAINAQHGGFPSRLLDVSYNSLIALFFAITPFYTKEITSLDKKDGYVYIFYLDEMFCPVGNGIKENYDEIIYRKKSWYTQSTLFNRNFKLIDHIKINSRIIAQQGAFILFQGLDAQPLPNSFFTKIRIEGDAKPKLRNELKQFFGIHMGTMYPEENNLVDIILEKSRMTNSREFDLKDELQLVLKALERDLDSCLCKLLSGDKRIKIIKEIEKEIFWYKKGFEKLEKFYLTCESNVEEKEKLLMDFSIKFNDIIEQCYSYVEKYSENEYINRAETLISVKERK